MKKSIKIFLLVLISNVSVGQKMLTRTGEINFEATVPGIEEIAGKSKSSSCVLDVANGDLAALILIKSFKFKSPLMEEHFNENYMESSQYPKSTFKGKIIGFDISKISNKPSVYSLEGELTIHGVSKKVTTKLNISKNGENIILTGKFFVKPQDYKIEIPSLVKNKIAENVEIDLNFSLNKS
jgi:hypothetical protein